jgi:excinuclease UvrABC ATPase subunit
MHKYIEISRLDCPQSREQYHGRCIEGKTYDYNGTEYECSSCGGQGYVLAIDTESIVEIIKETLKDTGIQNEETTQKTNKQR